MEVIFFKYQGTGNDFIMLDNLNGRYDNLTIPQIVRMCDRRFGIGADGLIRINSKAGYDFEVDYFNSDGSKSFCGNGARCSVAFAETLGIDVGEAVFYAIDGVHKAFKKGDLVILEMKDVPLISKAGQDFILDTGSPHYVRMVKHLKDFDIVEIGKSIRYSPSFRDAGINVNLVEESGSNNIKIHTYERGVEDETFSCGTGATACAIVFGALNGAEGKNHVDVEVKGGKLSVGFVRKSDGSFSDITLSGPAEFVFSGKIIV